MKTLLAMLLLIPCLAHASKPLFTLYTGNPKGTYTQIANDIKGVCTNLDIQVQPTQGTLQNINSLIKPSPYVAGNRIAFVQQDALLMATSNIDKKKIFKTVTPLYDEEIIVIASMKSQIHSLKDLDGKRVSIGSNGAGSWFTSIMIQRELNSKWIPFETSLEESILNILTGHIDAIVVVGGTPMLTLSELSAVNRSKIQIISIKSHELDKLYKSTSIQAPYAWANYTVDTKATLSLLIAASDVQDKDIRELKTCLAKNLPTQKKSGHPKWKQIQQYLQKR